MNTYTFILTSLIIIITPGTGVIYTISTGFTRGRRKGVFAALGCTLGILPHLIITILISSFFLKISDQTFFIIKLIGAFYLLYLGISMLLTKGKFVFNSDKEEFSVVPIMKKGIFINLLNPQLTLFFVSFLPQFIDKNSLYYLQKIFLQGIAFMVLSLFIFVIYAVLAGCVEKFLETSSSKILRLQQIFGIVFILLAINLATVKL